MNLKLFRLILINLLLFGMLISHADTNNVEILSPQELIKQLQKGGYIIYMRHGKTERKNKKRNKQLVDFNRCDTQRNLSVEGHEQVKNIGLVLKALKIPVGTVKSSPYCRTKDTAIAVFGHADIDQDLAFSIGKNATESKRLGEYLYNAMLASKSTTTNTVFVGHTANLRDGLGVWPKPEGVSVIFKNTGNKIIYKGMIKPDDWVLPSIQNLNKL